MVGMNNRYLIDLFGELEMGTFENDGIEQDIDSFRVRLKNRVKRLLQAIRNNIRRIITITMGIFAVIALAFSVIALISKKRKQIKAVA